MPYLRTRNTLRARLRRDGQFGNSLPSDTDANSYLNEAIAWWWGVLSRHERSGIGTILNTAAATPGVGFVTIPASQRHLREVYRDGQRDPAIPTTKLAYGNPFAEPSLPGVWWIEYMVSNGQIVQLRPTPSTAETITFVGTSEPPQYANDVATIDLISEEHERAIVDVTRARIHFRDDEAKRAAAEQTAARSVAEFLGMDVAQTPTHWSMWLR